MLTSITPLGERGRRHRWAVTTTAYALGSVLGGATTGLLLGGLGSLLPDLPTGPLLLLAGLVCLAAAAADLAPWRLPGGHRQVDEDWLTRYRGWVYGVGFGYQLGLGVVTVVTSAATYALLLLAVLTGSPLAGLLLGATFGLARAVPVLLSRPQSHAELVELAQGLEGRARLVGRATAATLLAGGAVLLAGAAA